MPDGADLVQSDSGSGDKCHYDVTKVSSNKLGKLIKRVPIEHFETCDENGVRAVTAVDCENWLK